jgi:hypothetical protein
VAGAVTAGVLAAVALTGCGPFNTFTDEHTDQVALTEVNLSGGAGSVTVRPGTEGSVRVHRTVRYAGDKRPGATDHVDGTVLKLNTDCGVNCSVSYEITAPGGVKVSGANGSGRLSLTSVSSVSVDVGSGSVVVRGASGAVNVKTGSGMIDLADVRGAVVARTGSGTIRLNGIGGTAVADTGSGTVHGSGLDGRTTVHTGSGTITLDLVSAQDVTARSGSGRITVTVPSGQKYRVTATTDSGRTDVKIPTDPSADHLLDLHADSGGVTVQARV